MMKESVTLRITKNSEPVFNQVSKVAKIKSENFTATLLELVKIGLKYYEKGYRLVEDEVIQLPNKKRTIYSTYNEVVESTYSSLAGSIADIQRFEESKKNPDQKQIKYYTLIGKSLWQEKRFFNTFSDKEIREKAEVLGPILKSIRLVDDYKVKEQIIRDNKAYFDELIKKTGV